VSFLLLTAFVIAQSCPAFYRSHFYKDNGDADIVIVVGWGLYEDSHISSNVADKPDACCLKWHLSDNAITTYNKMPETRVDKDIGSSISDGPTISSRYNLRRRLASEGIVARRHAVTLCVSAEPLTSRIDCTPH